MLQITLFTNIHITTYITFNKTILKLELNKTSHKQETECDT